MFRSLRPPSCPRFSGIWASWGQRKEGPIGTLGLFVRVAWGLSKAGLGPQGPGWYGLSVPAALPSPSRAPCAASRSAWGWHLRPRRGGSVDLVHLVFRQ